jgi:hypothetical protein
VLAGGRHSLHIVGRSRLRPTPLGVSRASAGRGRGSETRHDHPGLDTADAAAPARRRPSRAAGPRRRARRRRELKAATRCARRQRGRPGRRAARAASGVRTAYPSIESTSRRAWSRSAASAYNSEPGASRASIAAIVIPAQIGRLRAAADRVRRWSEVRGGLAPAPPVLQHQTGEQIERRLDLGRHGTASRFTTSTRSATGSSRSTHDVPRPSRRFFVEREAPPPVVTAVICTPQIDERPLRAAAGDVIPDQALLILGTAAVTGIRRKHRGVAQM